MRLPSTLTMFPWGSETSIRARSHGYDQPMWSLVYLIIRTLVALLMRTSRHDRDGGAKDLEMHQRDPGGALGARLANPMSEPLRLANEVSTQLAAVIDRMSEMGC